MGVTAAGGVEMLVPPLLLLLLLLQLLLVVVGAVRHTLALVLLPLFLCTPYPPSLSFGPIAPSPPLHPCLPHISLQQRAWLPLHLDFH